MMIGINCYEVIGMCCLYFILFNASFIPNLISQKQMSGDKDIHYIEAPSNLIVFIVFHQFGVIS